MTRNPYPGPRPLTLLQRELLYGRDADVDDVRTALRSYRLLMLTADSGVGKTSFLNAGLWPALDGDGYVVAEFHDWSDFQGSTALDQLVYVIRRACLDAQHIDVSDAQGRDFLRDLNEDYGPRLVLILDQLEELLRLDPDRGSDFLTEVAGMYSSSRRYDFKVVLSLRSEYDSKLTQLQNLVDPFRWTQKELRPVEKDVVCEVIVKPLDGTGVRIEDDAVSILVRAWMLGAFGSEDPDVQRQPHIGLLHLQALLTMLWEQTVEPGESRVITSGDVGRVLPPPSDDDRPDPARHARDAFAQALIDYIRHQMRVDAENEIDQDRANETRWIASRVGPRLASGGYKQILDTAELFLDTIPEVTDLFDPAESEQGRLLESLKNLVMCAHEIPGWKLRVDHQPTDRSLAEELVKEALPHLDDKSTDMTAGRLSDASPRVVAAELALSYVRALEWMHEASLVRFTPGEFRSDHGGASTRRRTAVSVTHDGFGSALREWGEKESRDQERLLASVVGLTAQSIRLDIDGGAGDRRILSHLVWLSFRVRGRVSNVEFRDCNFAATMFDGVRFENVRFVNCKGWGSLFVNCVVAGPQGLEWVGDVDLRSWTSNGTTFEASARLSFENVEGYGLYVGFATPGALEIRGSSAVHHLTLAAENAEAAESLVEVQESARVELAWERGFGRRRVADGPNVHHVVTSEGGDH